jgi:stage V sporulation protein R
VRGRGLSQCAPSLGRCAHGDSRTRPLQRGAPQNLLEIAAGGEAGASSARVCKTWKFMAQFATNTQLPRYLRVEQEKIEKIARGYGLDIFPTVFEMLSYDQMNEIAAYGGFPNRYPHWRFGMEYERLSKSYEYGLSKIYEMVINSNPSYAYLLEGNSLTDQKLVMCHVMGHVDFFKNNFAFRATDLDAGEIVTDPMKRSGADYSPNRRWVDKMANHGAAVRRIVDRYGVPRVEEFIDTCLSLENLIDPWSRFVVRRRESQPDDDAPGEVEVPRLRAKDYMEEFINPSEYIEEQRRRIEATRERERGKFPAQREQDVLVFLIEHAPLERWERAILSIIRDEAYYFVPQLQTKVMNEGWACVAPDTLVFTERGLLPMREVVAGEALAVADGSTTPRQVRATHVVGRRRTMRLCTRRGFELTGSSNHRVLLADGRTWRQLDQLVLGDKLLVAGGSSLWPIRAVQIEWPARSRVSLEQVAEAAGVSLWTVLRHRAGKPTRSQAAIAHALREYEAPDNDELPQAFAKRRPVRLPSEVTPELGSFLGYLIGDGHISRVKRHLGLTTGDEQQAKRFAELVTELFGLPARLKNEGRKLRVLVHSEELSDFLTRGLGLTHGPSAREKKVPSAILRSPEAVVRAFLRALFDCDGHAGRQGVILSSASSRLTEQVQLLLLNYGILSRKRRQSDGVFHVHVAGRSARKFLDCVGFGLARKELALKAYVDSHHFEKPERWEDEVVSLEADEGVVYDISVSETQRYAAAGLVNHNSFWHSRMMTSDVCDWSEIVDYAENNAGVMATSSGRLNPYKLGVELFRSIEERWNKGQFGREWEDCSDLDVKKNWDLRLGLGREKIFEVRALYNDVTFIDEFLTPEFAHEHKLFTFTWSNRNDRFEIESREFRAVKEKLLAQLTNFGNPFIYVEDGNFENRGELLLVHDHRGVDLRADYAKETLNSLVRVWRRPVCLSTLADGKRVLLRFDGKDHSVKHDAP